MTFSERAASGFLWFFGQTALTRLISFGGQVALAWLLVPSAFGLISMAYAIRALVSVIHQSGVDRILVAKAERFDELSTPAFWFALAMGVVAALIVFAIAPGVAAFYREPNLTGILWIFGLTAPFDSLRVLPSAILQRDLRFRPAALVNASEIAMRTAGMIGCAAIGLGAYSFALPYLITGPLFALVLWRLAPPRVQLRPQLSRWPEIAGLSGYRVGTALLGRGIEQGDYLILGAFYDAHQVGIYFLAYSLSIQTITLLDNNIGNTLFAVFSRINDEPQRQYEAFCRAARLLAILTVPACAFVAVGAGPLIRFLYADTWLPSVPILRILAIGMCLRVLGTLASSQLQSRARFDTLFVVQILRALIFSLTTLIAVRFGLLWFSIAASTPYLVGPILTTALAVRGRGRLFRILTNTLTLPILISLAGAVLCSLFISFFAPHGRWASLLVLSSEAAAFLCVGILFTRVLGPDIWKEIVQITIPYRARLRLSVT